MLDWDDDERGPFVPLAWDTTTIPEIEGEGEEGEEEVEVDGVRSVNYMFYLSPHVRRECRWCFYEDG